MITLSTVGLQLEVSLVGSVSTRQLNCAASRVDHNTTDFTISGQSTVAKTTNNTTPVVLVSGPAMSGYTVSVKFLSVFNADTSTATVKFSLFDGTTRWVIFQTALAAGATLQFTESFGWELVVAGTTSGGGSSLPVIEEIKEAQFSGAIDGNNRDFTMPHEFVSGTLQAYWNGIRLSWRNEDYTELSGTTIRLATAPIAGDNLVFDYAKV